MTYILFKYSEQNIGLDFKIYFDLIESLESESILHQVNSTVTLFYCKKR